MNDTSKLALPIKLLLLDVDGVLSDGQILYSSTNEELKSFHIHDGLGIKLLQRSGIEVGIITGRNSPMVSRRAAELGIQLLIQGQEDKLTALLDIQQQRRLATHEIAYMGDDLPDLAAIRHAGLGIAPANALPIVRRHADKVTTLAGGSGAVREAADFILASQNVLDAIHAQYLGCSDAK